MAVKIRLARHGSKKRPFYRIVVASSEAPRDGRYIDQVGTYDPTRTPERVELKAEKLAAWIARGARPTQTVAQLIRRSGAAGGATRHEGAGPVLGEASREPSRGGRGEGDPGRDGLGPRAQGGKGGPRTGDRQAGSHGQVDPHDPQCGRIAHQSEGGPRDRRREVACGRPADLHPPPSRSRTSSPRTGSAASCECGRTSPPRRASCRAAPCSSSARASGAPHASRAWYPTGAGACS